MSNRDFAVVFWGVICVSVLIFNKKSDSLIHLIKSFIKVISEPIMMIFIAYNVFIVCIIHFKFTEFNFEIFKDYFLATVVLFPVMINIEDGLSKVTKTKIIELFFISTFFSFIIEMSNFNIFIEIILIFLMFILTTILVVSETNVKYISLKKATSLIIGIFALSIIGWNIYIVINSWEDLSLHTLFISYFFEIFVFALNIPILFLIQPLVRIDTQVNFYKNDRKIIKFIKYLISKKYIRLKFRKYIQEANNLSINFDILSETIGYGSTRVSVQIPNEGVSQKELLVIMFSIITQTEIGSKVSQKKRFPNFIEIRNKRMELVAYWEEPLLKLKYKAFKLREFPYLNYGIKINTHKISKVE